MIINCSYVLSSHHSEFLLVGGNGQKDHQVSFNLHHGEKTPPNTELQGGGEKKLQRGVCRSHIVGWWSFVFPWHTELNISEHSEELKGREKKLWKSQHKTGFLHTFLAVFSLMWRRTVWSWGQISGNFKCAIKCAPWPFFFSLNTLSISTIFLRCDTCRNPKHYKNSWTPSISRSG